MPYGRAQRLSVPNIIVCQECSMASPCQQEARCKLSAGQGLKGLLCLPLMMQLLSSAWQLRRPPQCGEINCTVHASRE